MILMIHIEMFLFFNLILDWMIGFGFYFFNCLFFFIKFFLICFFLKSINYQFIN